MAQRVLVCIPARRAAPGELWTRAESGPVQAFTANRALFDALGYSEDMDEEADHAALVLASVWGLIQFGERFVLTAEVGPDQLAPGAEAANGGVAVTGLRPGQVVAFFTDPDEDAAAAARAAGGLSIDEAWELPEIEELLVRDLQWHDIDEWSR